MNLTHEEMSKILNINPSRLLKNHKYYNDKIKDLGYIKQGRGRNAIYIKNINSVDIDQLCYIQLREHLIESGCIKNGKRFNYDNFLMYIAFILGQEKYEVLSKQDYIKAIGISESTYDNYRKYLNTLGLIQPYNLSPTKYYVITKQLDEKGEVVIKEGDVQKYRKEITRDEYMSIYKNAYKNQYINIEDLDEVEDILKNKEKLMSQSISDILMEFGYYYMYSIGKTVFRHRILQEVGLMDMICRAIRYKHKVLVKIKKLDEKYIVENHMLKITS